MKRSPIKRKSPLKRTGRLAVESAKVRGERQARRDLLVRVRERDRFTCRARPVMLLRLGEVFDGATGVDVFACLGNLDGHEIIPRSAWHDGYLVDANVILVCRKHHEWIHNHTVTAVTLGLLSPSWAGRPSSEPEP